MSERSTDKNTIWIFVSYAGEDRETARQFQKELEKDSLPVEGDLNSQKYANFHISVQLHESEKPNGSGENLSPSEGQARLASVNGIEDEPWQKGVRASICNSQVVLLVQGKTTADRKKVKWEIEQALGLKKPIIVCQTEEVLQNNESMPDWLVEKKISTPVGDIPLPYKCKWTKTIHLPWKRADRFINSVIHFVCYVVAPVFHVVLQSTERATVFPLREAGKIRKAIIRSATKQYDIFSDSAKEEGYGEKLFEQYKMYQETAQALEERKQKISDFYLTINTAMLTFIGVILGFNTMSPISTYLVLFVITLTGFGFNDAWCRQIERNKIINTAKMRMINSIERQLPLRLYDEEYAIMLDNINHWKYKNDTEDEKRIPQGFNFLYVLFFCLYLLFFILRLAV